MNNLEKNPIKVVIKTSTSRSSQKLLKLKCVHLIWGQGTDKNITLIEHFM